MGEIPGDFAANEFLVDHLIAKNIRTPRVRTAFKAVDRGLFVPVSKRDFAYEDSVILLGDGSSISQPSLVAEMTELMQLN